MLALMDGAAAVGTIMRIAADIIMAVAAIWTQRIRIMIRMR